MESKQMSEKQEYMTIKEFAAAAGVTEQAVYKQLNNKLSTYSTMLNGKKVLKIEALKEYKSKEVETELTQKLNETEAEVNRLKEQLQQQKVDELSRAVNELKEQLKAKDQQIGSLHDLLKESQEALSRQQQLAALQEQRIVQLTASEPETVATVVHEEPEAEQIAAEQTAAEKKGLFRRILDVIRQQDSY